MNITKAAVVMDYVPFHKHQAIKNKFEESSHILLFLPHTPYFSTQLRICCKVEDIY